MRFLLIFGLLVAGKPFYKCYGDELCNSHGGICHSFYKPCAKGSASHLYDCGFPNRCCIALVSRYGDINDVNTTGASAVTAGWDKLSYHGVRASHKMAETDLQNMNRYKSYITLASMEWVIQPSIIAGIISRESRAGNSQLDRNGYGPDGGFGLMQGWSSRVPMFTFTYRTTDFVSGRAFAVQFGTTKRLIHIRIRLISKIHNPEGGPYSYRHISEGTGILVSMIEAVSAKHPTWTKEMKLKGGISAYNAGPRNVRTYENMDGGTTGEDYANDVVARAQWFKTHGYE